MGCFLACLGSSKGKKGKRLHSNRIPSGARDQRREHDPVEQVVYPDREIKPVQQVNEDAKPVEQVVSPTEGEFDARTVSVKSEAKKKVSFNSVVKTYEPVPSCELVDREEFSEDEKSVNVAKQSTSNSDSEAGLQTSSLVSYPPSHRYQNCRESDDEEELDDEESDIAIDDSELEEDEYSDGDALSDSLSTMESTTRVSPGGRKIPEDNSHENIMERTDSNLLSRGRDGYDQSVLSPVENLSQWKALKAMGKKPPLQRPQKENSAMNFNELPASPIFNQAQSLQPKIGLPEQQAQQMAVNASLSNWLISPEPVRKSMTTATEVHNAMPQQKASPGSYLHSPSSFDDRPILGAMTVEELKLLSLRTSSPRKSPSKSPDDMAIIGSVGSYWSQEKSHKVSPRDMRVNWDSNPFETRLEKALSQGSAEA